MRHLHQPQDRFFRAAFGQTDLARKLLADALPPSLLRRLDLGSLQVSGEGFVDPELASHQSDILMRTRPRGSPLLVYVLVEHKSHPYRWTLLQLLRHMVRIWERERARNPRARTLPPLVPLIVYHGRRRWRYALSFSGYFLADAELAAFVSALLEYILQAGTDVEARDLEAELERVGSAAVQEVYMTLADKLVEKGKAQGKLEGELEKTRQVLLRLLERKFGPLPASVRQRITGSRDREALDRAIDRVLEADSIEQVLAALD